jgi:hypothetical protein
MTAICACLTSSTTDEARLIRPRHLRFPSTAVSHCHPGPKHCHPEPMFSRRVCHGLRPTHCGRFTAVDSLRPTHQLTGTHSRRDRDTLSHKLTVHATGRTPLGARLPSKRTPNGDGDSVTPEAPTRSPGSTEKRCYVSSLESNTLVSTLHSLRVHQLDIH